MYELEQGNTDNKISAPRIGGSHGYRIEGDLASLNAELAFVPSEGSGADCDWALQLWACDEPYAGGALRGFKVAEAPIALSACAARDASSLDAVAFARPPAAVRDYSMVLVLAAGKPGAFDQVRDFANYPARERFVVPHFEGALAYELLEDGALALRVERVVNPRGTDNLSGSLALQLWALDQPYRGGEFQGRLLASLALGQLAGQGVLTPGAQRVALDDPPRAGQHLVLMLCEWSAAGYLTRDYCSFAEAYAAPARTAAQAEPAPIEAAAEPVAATAVEQDVDARGTAPEQSEAAPAVEPAAQRPSLHAASAEELARATGISLKLAETLVRGRPFKSFDDIARVRGIGEKTIRKLRAALRL